MQSKASTVAEYLQELPEERRKPLAKLRAMIRKVAPRAKESMRYGMIHYDQHGDLFGLASQKNYMALYVCCKIDVVEQYKPNLGVTNCGKGCVRFKSIEKLNLDAVKEMLAVASKVGPAKELEA